MTAESGCGIFTAAKRYEIFRPRVRIERLPRPALLHKLSFVGQAVR